jgi:hypothetical protein
MGCSSSKQDDVLSHAAAAAAADGGDGHHNKSMILKAPSNEQLGTFTNRMIHYLKEHVPSLDQLNHR